jgi:dihydrofolate reductase
MGRLIATEFISLDGVFEDPGGAEGRAHGPWTFQFERGDEGNRFKMDELMQADAQLLGRITYEGFAAAWPERTGDPFSDRFNSMPKYVVSSTLTDPAWNNSHVLSGDLAEDVTNLKAANAGDILIAGSGQLVRGLIAAGLLDELRLMVFPIVLGTGRRLLDETVPTTRLRLTQTLPVGPDGIVVLTYEPARVEAASA